MIPATGNTIACAALLVTLIFGIGTWIGQSYGNHYARKSYENTLWGLCADHPVNISRLLCSRVNINLNLCRVYKKVRFAAIVFKMGYIEASNEIQALRLVTI